MLMRRLLAGLFSVVVGLALVSGCTPPPGAENGAATDGSAPVEQAAPATTEKAPAPADEAAEKKADEKADAKADEKK